MDLCLRNDDPGQVAEIPDKIMAEPVLTPKGDAAAPLNNDKLAAYVVVAEG